MKKGFTLIELLVVISIIGVLSSVVLASVNSARARARDAKRISDLHQIQNALEGYYNDNNAYPVSTSYSPWNAVTWSLVGNSGTTAFYDGLVTAGKFFTVLPSDPTNKESASPPGSPNYLGDNAPLDQGYVYFSSDGQCYILGANLERGGTASNCGNYVLKGGTQTCSCSL